MEGQPDINKRQQESEQEAQKIKELQAQAEQQQADELARHEIDSRSIYIGNVDYSATPEEIQAHFQSCGTINRVTILCDKYTGHPKGFAYVEFADVQSVKNSIALHETMFKNRVITVSSKRTNVPFFMRGRGRGRGRGFPRGRARGTFRGRRGFHQPY
ncbi:cytoplasmic RNA-binding protein [Boothiomyces macroporosus]|uniref:Cytoplasmic RNA-binding protein n=1 Tax=Boothiomyces macroporosus TaxID=261099 RepID=A0AAD5UGN3_9FUNG|nr:cytoplasmic RNA-binding protein [Boothiomyces macroporosus]KAJ3315846.1 cytoplasmic RNA-binding protein [Boothiomyces sp. JEL0838]